MVNLLGRRAARGSQARFDAPQCDRIGARLGLLARLVSGGRLGLLARSIDSLEAEADELDAEPSRLAALALLDSIDRLRHAAARGPSPDPSERTPHARAGAILAAGDFVCHRPGRSLVTGEAEVASRGFFDAGDRPPLACWIGVLDADASHRPAAGAGEEDFVVVAWIPPDDRDRARAGCRACPNGALAMLEDVSPTAAEQLHAVASSTSGARR